MRELHSNPHNEQPEEPKVRPAKALADLMQSRLGVTIDPGQLHTFVCSNFIRLSKLAHAIHGSWHDA